MITEEQLRQLIQSEETDRVEKTTSQTDTNKFGEAICAFTNDLPNNNLPGYLIIGVDDSNSKISGLHLDESIQQRLMAFRTDGRISPSPSLTTCIFRLTEGDILVVEVMPSHFPPVRFKGKVCIRSGPRKGKATEQEEKALIEKRAAFAKTYDLLPCRSSSLDDLSLDIFRISYLPLAIDAETLDENHREIKQQLASLRFYDIEANCPTNAGIILFGNNPRFFIEGARVQYVKFAGKDLPSDFITEHSFEGDFLSQLRGLNSFIETNIVKTKLPEIGAGYEKNYPKIALQELIFNAVIHNDYSINSPIKVYEFIDRIEITNNGGLYGNAQNDFPNNTDYRNPVLAGAAKVLGFVNTFGVGIARAKNALAQNGNPPPEFIHSDIAKFVSIIYAK